ncbi:hypothetical protein [Funiculus sociatus]|nr:hypothetical protein [Trichocoleus sp. FACHB-40]
MFDLVLAQKQSNGQPIANSSDTRLLREVGYLSFTGSGNSMNISCPSHT